MWLNSNIRTSFCNTQQKPTTDGLTCSDRRADGTLAFEALVVVASTIAVAVVVGGAVFLLTNVAELALSSCNTRALHCALLMPLLLLLLLLSLTAVVVVVVVVVEVAAVRAPVLLVVGSCEDDAPAGMDYPNP